MSGPVGIIAFVVSIIVAILVHELGHLLTAKRYGMRADRYFVGFGPTLWSTQRGETEYGVKWLLFGGFALKLGIVPLHVWLPLAHAIAPAPASAVLSGVILAGAPYVIRPVYGLRRPRVRVRGHDLAGVVTNVGRDVRRFQPGDEVFGWTTTGSLPRGCRAPAEATHAGRAGDARGPPSRPTGAREVAARHRRLSRLRLVIASPSPRCARSSTGGARRVIRVSHPTFRSGSRPAAWRSTRMPRRTRRPWHPLAPPCRRRGRR
jgi:hypothetical protein